MTRNRHKQKDQVGRSPGAHRAGRDTFGGGKNRPTVVSRRYSGGTGGGRGALWFLGVVATGLAAYWAIGTYHSEIVRLAPFTYPYFRAIGMEVEEPSGYGLRLSPPPRVSREMDPSGRQSVLMVQGAIVNTTGERRALPKLRITVTGSRGASATWTYEPPQSTIEPGGQFRYQTRFQHTQMVVDPAVSIVFEKR